MTRRFTEPERDEFLMNNRRTVDIISDDPGASKRVADVGEQLDEIDRRQAPRIRAFEERTGRSPQNTLEKMRIRIEASQGIELPEDFEEKAAARFKEWDRREQAGESIEDIEQSWETPPAIPSSLGDSDG